MEEFPAIVCHSLAHNKWSRYTLHSWPFQVCLVQFPSALNAFVLRKQRSEITVLPSILPLPFLPSAPLCPLFSFAFPLLLLCGIVLHHLCGLVGPWVGVSGFCGYLSDVSVLHPIDEDLRLLNAVRKYILFRV